MKFPSKLSLHFGLASCFYLLFSLGLLYSQQAGESSTQSSLQTSTQERLEAEPWWPTKSTFTLNSFAGSDSCVKCHADEASSQTSAMQRAATPATHSQFLSANSHQAVSFPPFHFSMAGSAYSVTQGNHTASHTIDWVMGAGDLGRTFLYKVDGRWFQSQVTFYTQSAKLDTTTGFNTLNGPDIETALGQRLTANEARKCFGCHTVHPTTSAGFNPEHAEPGLGCEACHGPGREHVETMAAQLTNAKKPIPTQPQDPASFSKSAIFNPAALTPVDSIDFCGACHRTAVDATLAAGATSLGTAAVRFQPYRLEQSKCWRATQSASLTCTACHNPHQPLDHSVARYDKTCLGCHAAIKGSPAPQHAARLSAGGASSCVSCHMPKVEVSSMHGQFTDHRIRIAQQKETFPD